MFVPLAASASTQDLAAFYAGKTITIGVPGGAGGGYDAYARLLAQYFPKYLPGHPSMNVQYVPGGGGMVAANAIFNVANQDGTALSLLQSSTFLVGVLGDKNARFENPKFTLIGNMNQEVDTCSVWSATGIKDAEAFLHGHVLLGTTGPGSNGQTFPMGMMDALGADFKLIPGYSEGPARLLAMERGELQGTCGIFVSTLRSQFSNWTSEGKIRVVLQMALDRHPDLADVPNALELARSEDGRDELKALFSQLSLGRPIVAPPNVPPERAQALQAAFVDVMNDPDFLKMASQFKLEMRWFGPDRMREIISDMSATSAPVRAKLRKVLNLQ